MLAALLFHELPNGRVEVGLNVVAYPDRIEIAYRVDISDGSMRSRIPQDLSVSAADRLLDNYREQALKNIGEDLFVRIDGKEQAVKPLRSELGPRHPVRFICYYEVDLRGLEQSPGPIEFELRDQSYADFEKDFRCALHTKDGAEVVASNVADLLVRAAPHKLWELPATQREDLQTMRAKISLPVSASTVAGTKAEDRPQPFFRVWHVFAVLAAITVIFLVIGRLRR